MALGIAAVGLPRLSTDTVSPSTSRIATPFPITSSGKLCGRSTLGTVPAVVAGGHDVHPTFQQALYQLDRHPEASVRRGSSYGAVLRVGHHEIQGVYPAQLRQAPGQVIHRVRPDNVAY